MVEMRKVMRRQPDARFESVMPKFMSRTLLQDGYYAQDCQHKGVHARK